MDWLFNSSRLTRFDALWLGVGVLAVLGWGAAAQGQSSDDQPMYLDESLTAREQAAEARSLLERDRPGDAVQRLRNLERDHQSKLMRQGDGLYVDVARRVREIIGSNPSLLEAYRQKYSAQARRELELASRDGPDLAALEEVFATYRLTPSGLEAGLDLAGLYLARARIGTATGILAQLADHPDLESKQGRYHLLNALAHAIGDGSARTVDQSRKRLEALGETGRLQTLKRILGNLDRPNRDSGRPPQQAPGSDQDQPPETIPGEPLWSLRFASPLAGPELRSRRGQPLPPLEGHTRLNVLPTVSQSDLFINSGRQLIALDANSGRPLWRFDAASDAAKINKRSVFASRMSRLIGDKRGVLLQPGAKRVIAVVGQVTTTPVRLNRGDGGPTTALLALDRHSGAVRWRVNPGQIDPALNSADFRGTPIVIDGQILVLLTRTQSAGTRDTFIAAIDARTGRPRWHRHVAGARASQRYSIGPAPRMTPHAGMVYVSDSLGAVASINPRTGTVGWVRLLADNDSVDSRMVRALGGASKGPPDVSAPAVVQAGLVVPLGPSNTPAVVLDPQTGQMLRRLTAEPWTEPRLLAKVRGDLLAVGQTTTRYDGQTLKPRWQTDLSAASDAVGNSTEAGQSAERDQANASDDANDPDAGEDANFEPLGRPAIMDRVAVIPGRDEMLRLSLDDGRELGRIAVDGPGNLTAHREAIMLAGKLDFFQFRQWQDALRNLRRRIETNPMNPKPGLALAYLGLTAHRDKPDMAQAAMEGLDAAIAAVGRRSTEAGGSPATAKARREVFEQLLAFVDPSFDMSVNTRRKMYQRFAVVTTTPAQEMAYHLNYARFLRQEKVGQYRDAVEHYQAVLSSPTLAKQTYRAQGVSRQAGLEARRQLASLIEQQGRDVYQTYENLARSRLEALRQQSAQGQAYIDLAERFPLANSAADARYEAAVAMIERREPIGAVGQLRRAYHQGRAQPLRAKIAGRLATLYEDQDQPAKARRWLKRVGHEHPHLKPIRGGKPVALDAWIAELADSRSKPTALPELSLPLNDPRVIEGVMVGRSRLSRAEHRTDRFLLRDQNQLSLYRVGRDKPIWTHMLWGDKGGPTTESAAEPEANKVEPAKVNGRGALPRGRGQADGRGRIEILLGQRQPARRLAQRPGAIRVHPADSDAANPPSSDANAVQTLALTEGHIVLWSPRRKRLIGLNARTGKPIWPRRSAPALLSQVTDADRLTSDTGRLDKRIMDMIGIESRTRGQGIERPRIYVGAGESVICLADQRGRVIGIDQFTGQVLWRVRSPIRQLDRLAVGQTTLALAGQTNTASDESSTRLLVLDLITGEPRFATLLLGEQSPAWMGLDHQGRLFTAEDEAVVARETQQGRTIWRQSVSEAPPWSGQGWVGSSMVVLADRGGRLHVFDAADGSAGKKISPAPPAGGMAHPRRLELIDQHAFMLTPQAVSAFDVSGRTRWRDAIHPPSVQRQDQVVASKHVLVTARPAAEQIAETDPDSTPPTLMLYLLNRKSGLLNDVYRLVIPDHDQQAAAPRPHLLDNRLLITVGKQTLVYPGAKAE